MKFLNLSTLVAAASTLLTLASAQTYTSCNPLQGTCTPDTALGKTVSVDFSKGASSYFTAAGNVTYGPDGASFTISKSGDSPIITSNWYIMFGKVTTVIKASPGVGIVSSSVLQSDDLDEIDWEWLGADSTEVQTNYYGKGLTLAYDRGGKSPIATSQSAFNTYTVEYTSAAVTWSINGQIVRTLTPASADTNQYPQTPMQVKIGSWSAGDSSQPVGTVTWAGGSTDYTKGPFSMVVKSVTVEDYSTGTEYKYDDTTGNWQSISAVGGSIGSTGAVAGSGSVSSASTITPMSTTTKSGSSSASSASAVSSASSASSGMTTSVSRTTTPLIPTTYSGLPSGWIVTSSGKVMPVSSASTRKASTFTHFPHHHLKNRIADFSPAQTSQATPSSSSSVAVSSSTSAALFENTTSSQSTIVAKVTATSIAPVVPVNATSSAFVLASTSASATNVSSSIQTTTKTTMVTSRSTSVPIWNIVAQVTVTSTEAAVTAHAAETQTTVKVIAASASATAVAASANQASSTSSASISLQTTNSANSLAIGKLAAVAGGLAVMAMAM